MFDMSWSELLLIAIVALIVIGPKDLPRVIKTVAQFARKARSLAREFQSGVEEMAREAELHEIKNEIDKAGSTDLNAHFENTIDPGGHVAKELAGHEPIGHDPTGHDLDRQAADAAASPAATAPAITAPTTAEPAVAAPAPVPPSAPRLPAEPVPTGPAPAESGKG